MAGKTTKQRPINATRKRGLAIIGVGNPLMADDGAGIAVLGLLSGLDLPKGVEIIDAGTGGMALLHVIARFDSVVIADAVDMGLEPGTTRSFSPDDAISTKELRRLSLHEGDVFEVLLMARQLGQCPGRVVICAIQPKKIRPKVGLSRETRAKLPAYARTIAEAVVKMA